MLRMTNDCMARIVKKYKQYFKKCKNMANGILEIPCLKSCKM